jgi:hydroxypyruvate isomerase
MKIKQSVCFPIFKAPETSLEILFQEIAAIGYSAVELWQRDDEFDQILETAKRHSLAVASMIGHQALEDGLNDRSNHDRIESELRTSIEIAADNGIPGIICFSGNRRDGLSEEDGIGAVTDGLRRTAPFAEEKGVNLNLELLNSKVDHPGYQCDRTSWGVAVCERVSSPRVKLLYDIYHMQIMEGDLIRTIRENIGSIGHFHTAGNPGRADMDDTQELNYRGICGAIAETSYDGYVGHELTPKGDLLQALRNSFQVCNI